jgi:hypothetical protein
LPALFSPTAEELRFVWDRLKKKYFRRKNGVFLLNTLQIIQNLGNNIKTPICRPKWAKTAENIDYGDPRINVLGSMI